MRIVKCALLAALACVPVPGMAQVDLDLFLKQDSFGEIKLSPTGEYYAATVPLEDRTVLAIIRRSDHKPTAKASGRAESAIADFEWVSDTRVVVSLAQTYGREDTPSLTGELYAVNADGSQAATLTGPEAGAAANVVVIGGDQTAAYLIDPLRGDDRHVLVSVMPYDVEPTTRVEKLDVYSGRRSRVASAPVRRASFTTDESGAVRFAHGAGRDNVGKLYHRPNDGAPWTLVNDEALTHANQWPLGFSADGRIAYLQVEHAEGPDAIVAWDTVTNQRTELLRDARVDPYRTLRGITDDVPVGALYMHDGVRSRFFDEQGAVARRYRSLERAFPGQVVRITSATKDGRLLLVQVWSDRNPGDFYLFDTQTKAADLVFSRRRWFDVDTVPATRSVEVVARDGLKLHGYLTQPRDAKGPAPLVVMPHGGPYGVHDEWWFDDEAVMLSQAGYAVLRVNYRGSGNYGRAFMHAGALEWGRKMQDDLTDATRWAVEQGIADAGRICLYGASYGGYAALMGVAREPSLYRCAAGYVGVYDMDEFHDDDSDYSRSRERWVLDWLGDEKSMAGISPVLLVPNIKVPVFLAAGGKDRRVPIEHSKRMEKALKKAGMPVETLYFDTEGHGFYTEPHRREYYTRLLAFLSRHLGGSAAATGGH
jgi:dipeptidyl aminopeptidase/acylaminoacyl peptidase